MAKQVSYDEIARTSTDNQTKMFDDDWSSDDSYWWGMPSFKANAALPVKRITVSFKTMSDYVQFCEIVGAKGLSAAADSLWYPMESAERLAPVAFFYDGPKVSTKYPVCIPSKGRADCQKTGDALAKLGISHRFFVEETEYDEYVKYLGAERVVRMPFHDLGLGSIPARNFIWDWAKENNHRRHWVVDDNIQAFIRFNNGRRIRCRSGMMFRAMEDFVDRYTNVVLAGPHNQGFVPDRQASLTPVMWNNRVYSCILIDTSLDVGQWRGKYNEDTDLSIRAMKAGYCTVIFRAFLMHKLSTAYSRGSAMKGGNTDNVYNSGDFRLSFATSLKEQHPDIVDVVWKFNRWHHQVDYSKFKSNMPILRDGVVKVIGPNEYEMLLYKKTADDGDVDEVDELAISDESIGEETGSDGSE